MLAGLAAGGRGRLDIAMNPSWGVNLWRRVWRWSGLKKAHSNREDEAQMTRESLFLCGRVEVYARY